MGFFESMMGKGILYLANREIKEMGEFEELTINKEAKTIFALLLLKGEREPISINISNYRILNFGEKDYLQFESITISREWMSVAANKFLRDKLGNLRIEIPSEMVLIL